MQQKSMFNLQRLSSNYGEQGRRAIFCLWLEPRRNLQVELGMHGISFSVGKKIRRPCKHHFLNCHYTFLSMVWETKRSYVPVRGFYPETWKLDCGFSTHYCASLQTCDIDAICTDRFIPAYSTREFFSHNLSSRLSGFSALLVALPRKMLEHFFQTPTFLEIKPGLDRSPRKSPAKVCLPAC